MNLAGPVKFGWDPLQWEIVPRIHLGPVAISPHGIGIALGFLIGAQYMVRRSKRFGGPSENDIWNALFWALLGSMAGARIAYVIGHLSEVTNSFHDPLGVFKVWEGGISLLGGIIGAVLAAVPYVRKHRLGFWTMTDLAAPGLALGIFIGRIGDLMIGDHLGKPTTFALGWRCLGERGGIAPQPASVYRAALERGDPPSLGLLRPDAAPDRPIRLHLRRGALPGPLLDRAQGAQPRPPGPRIRVLLRGDASDRGLPEGR